MHTFLIAFLISIFVALLFFNVFFKIKIVKLHRLLQKEKVEFSIEHIINMNKLKNEILPRYPDQKSLILSYVKNLRLSVVLAAMIVLIITMLGMILKAMV